MDLKILLKWASVFSVLFLSWMVKTYHRGVADRPVPVSEARSDSGRWIQDGLNHLILEGNSWERGRASGRLTKDLLRRQEAVLYEGFKNFFPAEWQQQLFILGLIRWFDGMESFFDLEVLQEMSGVAESASPDFNFLADPFTRQIAYHGMHEVGQYFIDFRREDAGCTVFLVPHQEGWLVGRNFDFEAGRIFDEEKILKWVFPENGNAYVSVSFAGMVGVVTGVNEHGLYLSINAAGSGDFARFGTPSTLVLLRALQFSKTLEETIQIIKNGSMFISDIFVLVDTRSGRAVRLEKSPERFAIEEIQKASVVTNHLISPTFQADQVNEWRKSELTTLARQRRGEMLIQKASSKQPPLELVLRWMRDRKNFQGEDLPLGHRSAIDSMIATHGVLFDSRRGELFVSQGPALIGAFRGYDLKASFRERRPIWTRDLPIDPEVTVSMFRELKSRLRLFQEVQSLVQHGDCTLAGDRFRVLRGWKHPNRVELELKLLLACEAETPTRRERQRELAREALEMSPAYASQRQFFQENLTKLEVQ